MKKRRHHYVWQHYLSAWTSDDKIACLRGDSVFETNTVNVAVEKDFYRLADLTTTDLLVINGFSEKAAPLLQQLHQGWFKTFTALFDLERQIAASGMRTAEVERALDVAKNNLEEDLHAGIEGSSIHHLDALRRGDMAFLVSPEEFGKFSYFLAVQYMRTRKLRSASVVAVADLQIPGFDFGRAWGLLSHIFATNIGYALMSRRASHRVTLLEAERGAEFITSDQPAINLLAYGKGEHEEADELSLYYPVSPSRALLIEADQGAGELETRTVDEAEVGRHNQVVHAFAHEQTFASSKDRLRRASTGR